MRHHPNRTGHPTASVVAGAAIRRARFLRDEVESGRVPPEHPLAGEYLAQAERLEELYPYQRLRALHGLPAEPATGGATVTTLHPTGDAR